MQDEAFETIVRQYRDNLFAIAFQYTKNAADADDMVQIALIKCYKSDKCFESEQHIRNWLIRVTVNECKRYLVSPWRRYTAPIEDYAATLGFESPEQSALFFAVMALPQKYRVILLRGLFGARDRGSARPARKRGADPADAGQTKTKTNAGGSIS